MYFCCIYSFNGHNGLADSIKKTKGEEGVEREYETVDMVLLPREYEIPLDSYNKDYEPVDPNPSSEQQLTAADSHETANADNETKTDSPVDSVSSL